MQPLVAFKITGLVTPFTLEPQTFHIILGQHITIQLTSLCKQLHESITRMTVCQVRREGSRHLVNTDRASDRGYIACCVIVDQHVRNL